MAPMSAFDFAREVTDLSDEAELKQHQPVLVYNADSGVSHGAVLHVYVADGHLCIDVDGEARAT